VSARGKPARFGRKEHRQITHRRNGRRKGRGVKKGKSQAFLISGEKSPLASREGNKDRTSSERRKDLQPDWTKKEGEPMRRYFGRTRRPLRRGALRLLSWFERGKKKKQGQRLFTQARQDSNDTSLHVERLTENVGETLEEGNKNLT